MPLVSSGRSLIGYFSPGTAGSENDSLEVWTPGYHGYSGWTYDPGMNGVSGTGASTTQTCWAFRIFCPKAFTLSKLSYWIQTVVNTPTTAGSTTLNQTGVDLTTLSNTTLTLTATTNFLTGSGPYQAICATTSPVGFAVISYLAVSGSTLTNCNLVTFSPAQTGTLANGGAVTQLLSSAGVFNNAGTALLGFLPDQATNWGTAGWCGAVATDQSLNIVNNATTAITAGSYLWVVYMTTGTGGPSFRGSTNHTNMANIGIAAAGANSASLRAGRISSAQLAFPSTFTPANLNNTNTNSPGYPWFAVK